MKRQLRTYKFYFSQVNQEVYEARGFSIDGAFKRAQKEWKLNNSTPTLLSVEELSSKTWKELDHD